ncbi:MULTISPECIES: DUF7521 family protein [Saliphagus]|uniref:Histidine kinase N-terminal 7TM region domain-containing protein n=1 Tax=Saliphagus infecundisoli TaxID=1849069 RepID=A0ABD5Q9F7_9EURY|nr:MULTISPECIES: hypothetical protein [Saliphagus]
MTDVVRLDQAPLVELLSVASLLLVALLGTVIAVQAYRGYRRNDSRPMLYLAVGLWLLTLVPFLLNVSLATTGVDRVEIALAENVARLLGLLAITYSLYGID